jgi:hypothetical protein
MKLRISMLLAASLAVAGTASADMVAGWDFSQYAGQSFLAIDSDLAYANTLEANYSDLDPSLGAGRNRLDSPGPATTPTPECGVNGSCQFGRFYFDGSFGSTAVAGDAFVPGDLNFVSGSLDANLNAPGTISFDTQTVLQGEGQRFFSEGAMEWTGAGSGMIVFETTVSGLYTDWVLTFAGVVDSGTSTVSVEFADSLLDPTTPDYAFVGDILLNTQDVVRSIDLDGLGLTTANAFVRLTLNGSGGTPQIDNVALSATFVPEPGTALLMLMGLLGLGLGARRRA